MDLIYDYARANRLISRLWRCTAAAEYRQLSREVAILRAPRHRLKHWSEQWWNYDSALIAADDAARERAAQDKPPIRPRPSVAGAPL
jgi:hypothetical protein